MALTDGITAPAARKSGRDVGFAIGIVTILHERMHQIDRFKEDFFR